MKQILFVFTMLLVSCSSDDTSGSNINDSLMSYIDGKTIETGAVIACSGNIQTNQNSIEVYFFPETGSNNFKLFETSSSNLDQNDYSNYDVLVIPNEPFFNGFLRKFVGEFDSERWIIVTYEIDDEIKLSNPIRIKQSTQPTLFSNDISLNQEISQMPIFSWDVNSEVDNAIFFQVLSTVNDDVISATYTFENQFQYYDTSNVVLNVTQGTPPILSVGQDYKFTLMDVSEDNWVNQVITTQFTVE
ncbi:hypothetical protein [uncultured Winogradskyella sp.]|uniref:hypothetical protein n=1 Tax=uncultured Winogradskyella sp. TaxID=395353 RepID=UPI00262EB333|nr:hypothetical protein [uncultured Winogradskyella sp.]